MGDARAGENPLIAPAADLNEPERKRILFVDDEPRVLDGLRRMLHTMRGEWDMVFTPGAGEALAALAIEPFDVIVTDMRMPGRDGADLLNEVVKSFPQTVRLVLSGQWDQQVVIRAARTAHQYLMKPCSAEDLKATLRRIFMLRGMMAGKTLKRVIAGLTTLPTVPRAHALLMETLEEPHVSTDALSAAISQDIGMTAKVLQLANSSFFGGAGLVSGIGEACLHLGSDTIRALAEASGVFCEFRGDPAIAASLEQMQHHASATARFAANVAAFEGVGKTYANEAVLAALLHDVGKLVLITMDAEMYALIPMLVKSGGTTVSNVEREVFGATHAEAGAYLLWLWGLPPNVVDAVAHHHSPPRPDGGLNPLLLVHVSDSLALELEPCSGEHPAIDEDLLQHMGLAERLPAWRELGRVAATSSGGAK